MANETQSKANAKEEFLFSDMYKYSSKSASMSQQQRRDALLKEQRENRHILVDSQRNISELLEELAEDNEIENTEDYSEPEIPLAKPTLPFKLMNSEWFTDIPYDLEDNWLVKFCPEGFRILLIAKKNRTICYNERGRLLFHLKSHFPGGGGDNANGVTVLDCVYNKNSKIIFILDCLLWNNMSLLDSEASFRFYWLKTKFVDIPQLQKSYSSFKFVLLEFFSAQRPLIQDEMFKPINIEDERIFYDGVVFYHKESQYTFGYTPLVAWLSSYMLPEKLGIDVLPENMVKKPNNYICLEKYIEDLATKKNKFQKKMDIT